MEKKVQGLLEQEESLFLTGCVTVFKLLNLFMLFPYFHKRGKRTSFTGFPSGPGLVCKVSGPMYTARPVLQPDS